MLSELGTACHGKTAPGKGYTKMLVTGGGGEMMRQDFPTLKCFLKAFTKQPCKQDAAFQHPSQPARGPAAVPQPQPEHSLFQGHTGAVLKSSSTEEGNGESRHALHCMAHSHHQQVPPVATGARSRADLVCGRSFLLDSSGMHSPEKQQQKLTQQFQAQRETPPEQAHAELPCRLWPHHVHAAELHLHICICALPARCRAWAGLNAFERLPVRGVFKTFPSSEKTKDYAVYFQAIHHWYRGG